MTSEQNSRETIQILISFPSDRHGKQQHGEHGDQSAMIVLIIKVTEKSI